MRCKKCTAKSDGQANTHGGTKVQKPKFADVKDLYGNRLVPGDIVIVAFKDWNKKTRLAFGVVDSSATRIQVDGSFGMDTLRVDQAAVMKSSLEAVPNENEQKKLGKLSEYYVAHAVIPKREITKRLKNFYKAIQEKGIGYIEIAEAGKFYETLLNNPNAFVWDKKYFYSTVKDLPTMDKIAEECGLRFEWQEYGYPHFVENASGSYYMAKMQPLFTDEERQSLNEPEAINYRSTLLGLVEQGKIDEAWKMFLEQPNKEYFDYAYQAWENGGRINGLHYRLSDALDIERYREITLDELDERFRDWLEYGKTISVEKLITYTDSQGKKHETMEWVKEPITPEIVQSWKKALIESNFAAGKIDW